MKEVKWAVCAVRLVGHFFSHLHFFFILVKRIFRFVSFFLISFIFFLFFSFSILVFFFFFCHSHLEIENRGSRAPCQSSVVEKRRETEGRTDGETRYTPSWLKFYLHWIFVSIVSKISYNALEKLWIFYFAFVNLYILWNSSQKSKFLKLLKNMMKNSFKNFWKKSWVFEISKILIYLESLVGKYLWKLDIEYSSRLSRNLSRFLRSIRINENFENSSKLWKLHNSTLSQHIMISKTHQNFQLFTFSKWS